MRGNKGSRVKEAELSGQWSEEQRQKLFKRSLWIVALSQMFGGAGLAAGITVGALLAQDMLGTDSFAGAPVALITLGSAVTALFVGRLSQRAGRRNGLATGFLLGGIGALGVIFAAVTGSAAMLFASLLVYGAGTSTNLQARYAATDLAAPNKRATAISTAMVATTFGAVAGPNLVDVMGNVADSMGIPRLAGPFLLAAAAFLLAGAVLFVLLRPDPLLIAQAIAKEREASAKREGQAGVAGSRSANTGTPWASSTGSNTGSSAELSSSADKRGIVVGAAVMIMTQIVMVAIMTMTPVHMKMHGHGLGDVGLVIGIHVGAMYLPSLFTGVLVDKIGRIAMTVAAGITLLGAGILAAAAPGDSMPGLTIALALLGIGWNFGLISGTTLIVDATTASTRAKTQGSVDVLIALTGASSGAMSGVIASHTSYSTLALGGGFLALLLVPVVIWSLGRREMETIEASG
ncbi:MFS transporter [Paenibacillus sp. HB172176]|uniref:MFS transporter n=1 Tax=Paenibacillus sp. HB172176 TaxID=2493690 RepID=UPI0014389A4A|nr:MFS transporter [Paenibacillus sp. HB172176]